MDPGSEQTGSARAIRRATLHNLLAAAVAGFFVAALLALGILVAAPSVAIQLMLPITCSGGTLVTYWWSESGRLGATCVRPGLPALDVGDRTFLVLTALLTAILTPLVYVWLRRPSAAFRAWNRRRQR